MPPSKQSPGCSYDQAETLRVGKVGLNKYLYRIGASETELCTNCNDNSVEDVNHYVMHCPCYQDARDTLYINLTRLGIINITLELLLGFSGEEIQVKKKITTELGIFLISTNRLDILK